MAKVEITYKCEVCENDFVSHRTRKGHLLCATCIGELRKKGQGPIQLASNGKEKVAPKPKPEAKPKAEKPQEEAVDSESEAESEPEAEAPAPEAPKAEGGTSSLADLAKSLREKHQKKADKPAEEA